METNEPKTNEPRTNEPKKSRISKKYALAVVVVIVLLGAVYLEISSAAPSVVSDGDVINVSYTGSFTNGTVFSTNVGKQPMQFTVGSGQLIKGFDQGVVGMHVGQNKTITLTPSEAYGEVNSSLFVPVSANILGNQTLTVGMVLTRTTGTQQEEGLVTAVNATTATVDFNPPLAGKTLIFDIKVLSIHRA
jgi:FKBP-type peptidyl-prolyl cis-trans isomerase 2